MTIRTRVPIEVRYAETDQMGVVHHANYLVWFELARTRLCASSGFPYAEIERQGHMILVTGATLSYRRGARYGDDVVVECWLERLASRGLAFAYEVRRGDEVLATGATEHVWVDGASRRPGRIPSPYREAFAALLEQPEPAPAGAS
ncbi:MAG: thioesterase family protein [Thermoanaerobaculia bacterium]|nr:thioesterase family protein [Thermoanaerobaculia bacterium]